MGGCVVFLLINTLLFFTTLFSSNHKSQTMRVKRVATVFDESVVVCRVLEELKDGNLSLLLLDGALESVKGVDSFVRSSEECVKVVLLKNKAGVIVNYDQELRRATVALINAATTTAKGSTESDEETPPLKKRRVILPSRFRSDSLDDVFSCSSLERRRQYSPSSKGQHHVVKSHHNFTLCKQYNEMMQYYNKKRYDSKHCFALVLDSEQLATQSELVKQCGFTEGRCLIPNPYEYESLLSKKSLGLHNMTLGSFLKKPVLTPEKTITFAWFDYMNSLDGNLQDTKCGESSPRDDIALYMSKWAKPYTLFAVTLCLRHSKYSTHDYSGGTEVVIMRYVNDVAREAGFYFSILPPTCSYGSSMFIYAGVLLPLVA